MILKGAAAELGLRHGAFGAEGSNRITSLCPARKASHSGNEKRPEKHVEQSGQRSNL
jgi:hypothetical protein